MNATIMHILYALLLYYVHNTLGQEYTVKLLNISNKGALGLICSDYTIHSFEHTHKKKTKTNTIMKT